VLYVKFLNKSSLYVEGVFNLPDEVRAPTPPHAFLVVNLEPSTSSVDPMSLKAALDVELFKRGGVWWADFRFNGKRLRKSTKPSKKTAAQEVATQMEQKLKSGEPLKVEPVVVPTLTRFANGVFLPYIGGHSDLEPKTKEGYRYGWSLLANQAIAEMRMDQIKTPHLDMIRVEGSPSTRNCALRTLSRMLHLAIELESLSKAPKVSLREERERTNCNQGWRRMLLRFSTALGVTAPSRRP